MDKTYFKHMSLHKRTGVVRGQHGVEVKNIMDMVLVKKEMLRYMIIMSRKGGSRSNGQWLKVQEKCVSQ